MTRQDEVEQLAQEVRILVPVPQGLEFRKRLDALATEFGMTVGEGNVYCPAAVSGAGMRFVSGE